MTTPAEIRPIPYAPAYEVPEEEEQVTTFDLKDTMHGISVKTYQDSGHAIRSVHAKTHGLLVGELSVLDGLPPAYAQGLFAQAGRYPAVIRLSTTPGDILSDDVSTPRGLSLKVVGVPGARV